MDQTCTWTCGSDIANKGHTEHDADHQRGPMKAQDEDDDNKFCNGFGTDMYMKGFTVRFVYV